MTYQPSICVITPTIGRPTLRRTLESGAKDLGADDQWVVVADGIQPVAMEIWRQLATPYLNVNYFESLADNGLPSGDYGNRLRDIHMRHHAEDYFIFLDDDDVFAPNAIKIIKREIAEHYPRPIIFRMINGNGELLWHTREVTPGNLGGSMFCCPNVPGRLGTWANGAGHQSDLHFIEHTLTLYGPGWRQNLFWSGDVIVHCRPEAK